MKPSWLLLPFLALAGVANHPAGSSARLIEGYRSWRKVTAVPQDMSLAVALSCAMPPRWLGSDNPHVPKAYLVYVNKIGESAMFRKGKTTFPDGSVIVKEKYNRSDLVEVPRDGVLRSQGVRPDAKPVLLTVMTKKDGAWTYLVVDSKGQVVPGDAKACMSCHKANVASDFVFRSYVPGAIPGSKGWFR